MSPCSTGLYRGRREVSRKEVTERLPSGEGSLTLASTKIGLRNEGEILSLCGKYDEHLRAVEESFNVNLLARGNGITIRGDKDKVERAERLLQGFLKLIRRGERLQAQEVKRALKMVKTSLSSLKDTTDILRERIEVSSRRQYIKPRTRGQKQYVEAIKNYDIVFAIGPAGTGKTYLAMALAVQSLLKKEVSRIILTRPAVEAGERLGYLPGDLYAKVTPYLRPLYDALYDMMEVEEIEKFLDRGIIEVAPLAFMRGRTLNDAFIILDEAQNSTSEQMKMFLTRLGFDSKTVITGDVTQVDLPSDKPSGLIQVQSILKDVQGIEFVYLTGEDVVRHELVQEIIKAYGKNN
ncbi:MAG: PhoH family protein [Nitrospirae bacterium]|nr:PhoH family protein [Nitrospirota bacterium]